MGGRFLAITKDENELRVMSDREVKTKVSQALRDRSRKIEDICKFVQSYGIDIQQQIIDSIDPRLFSDNINMLTDFVLSCLKKQTSTEEVHEAAKGIMNLSGQQKNQILKDDNFNMPGRAVPSNGLRPETPNSSSSDVLRTFKMKKMEDDNFKAYVIYPECMPIEVDTFQKFYQKKGEVFGYTSK